MTEFSSSDSLLRLRRELKRPTNDAGVDDTDLYQLLTEGMRYTQALMAKHGLTHNAGWEQATTSDTMTYTIASEPEGTYTLRDGRNGTLLVVGEDGDPGVDLVRSGLTFLVPNQLPRVFANGLWVYYTPEHGEVTTTAEPTLKPLRARLLGIYHAAELWYDRGGYRDSEVYAQKFQKLAFGSGLPGDVGLIPSKKQPFAVRNGPYFWWKSNDFIGGSG